MVTKVLSKRLVCLLLGIAASTMAPAVWAEKIDLLGVKKLGSEFRAENHQFSGQWPERKEWKSRFCQGHSWYLTGLEGDIGDKTDFQLNDDGSVDIYADLYNVRGRVDGLYQSSYTLCREIGGWLGLRIDRVEIRARVYLPDDDEPNSEPLKVDIISTKFGTIHMGKRIPHWFESFTTKGVNRAVVQVWRSKLGDWLTKKLANGLADYTHLD